MPKYKNAHRAQGLFLNINLSKQLLPSTIEYSVNDIVSNHLSLRTLDTEYHNGENGAPAYPPSVRKYYCEQKNES